MRLTQAIERNAQISPNKVSTLCHGRERTWLETKNRIAQLASGFKSSGLEKGQRVAILSLNSDYYFESFYSIAWADGIIVPLNIRWSVAENVYALEDSGSEYLIVDDMFLDTALQIQSRIKQSITLIYAGEKTAPEGMLSLNLLIENSTAVTDANRHDEECVGIFYTGGTTGFPKGVVLSHRALWSSSFAVVADLDIAAKEHNYLHAAPMFHLADIGVSYAATIAGATQSFIPAFTPEGLVRAIENYKVSYVLLVPTMISMLVADPVIDTADMSSLENIIYGASPITDATLRLAMDKVPDVSFYQAYGQSEMAPLISVLRPDQHVLEGEMSKRLRSAGRAGYCVDLKIINDEGAEQPRGKVGEIIARGPNAMDGYWNKPEQTAAALVNGWVHTGDAGYMDEEGFIYLVDRVKDMIISGGENVFSTEVENAVARHEAVHEVVVLGTPSEKWGEQVHAIVRLKPGQNAEPETLIKHCQQWIAGYKCPRTIEFREEPFPITGAGKIRKVELRDEYWKNEQRKVH